MKIESIAFSPNPKLSPLNSKEWFLAEELNVWIQHGDDRLKWTIPKGFVTDLRSGPDFVKLALPKWGDDSCSCVLIVLHDYNYCGAARVLYEGSAGEVAVGAEPGGKYAMNKDWADELLVEGLRWNGHPGWKCALVGWGIKMFGGSHFGKDKVRVFDESKQEAREL